MKFHNWNRRSNSSITKYLYSLMEMNLNPLLTSCLVLGPQQVIHCLDRVEGN